MTDHTRRDAVRKSVILWFMPVSFHSGYYFMRQEGFRQDDAVSDLPHVKGLLVVFLEGEATEFLAQLCYFNRSLAHTLVGGFGGFVCVGEEGRHLFNEFVFDLFHDGCFWLIINEYL